MTEPAHAILSPSSAHRWMHCAAAPALEHGIADKGSEFADEGTAAHALASWCLETMRRAESYVGTPIEVNGRTFTVDDDMARYVQVYADRVLEYQGAGELMVEQRLSLEHITGEADGKGTSDAVIVTADGLELQVHDLKYGRGVRVGAEQNEQLMLYALGALEQFGILYSFERVRMVIHQPRLEHVSEWDCTVDELLAFGARATEAAKTALTALEFRHNWLGKPEAEQYFEPGEKICLWCKAKASCSVLARHVQKQIGADFADLTQPATQVADLIPAESYELGEKMTAIALIEDWCKAIRAEVERRLFAGVAVDGYKLVEGKRGNRAWSDEQAAEDMLRKQFRLPIDDAYNLKLISPAQAEKLLKTESPKRWTKLQTLIGQSDGKPSVAPISDKRPALVITPTADDFEDLSAPADESLESLV